MDLDAHGSYLTITAHGPAADGQLPLAEVARLCGEFQATLERIALSLQGGSATAGRRPKDVVEAVRMVFSGFRAGSAVLELDRPDASPERALLQESLTALEQGATAIAAGSAVPEAFSVPVIDGLIRLAGGLGDGFITKVVIGGRGQTIMTIDPPFREALREARRRVRHDETTIVGLLQMGDFAPTALRCRIDTIDSSVLCTFDKELASEVLSALGGMVVASGMGEFLPGGTLRSLDIIQLSTVGRGRASALDELAREQGVGVWQEASPFGFAEQIEDADFDAFLERALSSRQDW